MKYYFNTKQEFEANKNILKKKSISFIRDTREIYSEGNFYKTPVELIQGIGQVNPYGYKAQESTDDLSDFTYISDNWEKVNHPDMGTIYYCLLGIQVKDNEVFQIKIKCTSTELLDLSMFTIDGNIEDIFAGEEPQIINVDTNLEDNTVICTIPSISGEHQIYLNVFILEEYIQDFQNIFPEISVSIINKISLEGNINNKINEVKQEVTINLNRVKQEVTNNLNKVKQEVTNNINNVTNNLNKVKQEVNGTNNKVSNLESQVKFLTNNTNFAHVGIDGTNSSSLVDNTNKSWIKGKRCLAKHISDDEGVAICYLDNDNSNLFHDGATEAKLDGTMGEVMVDTPDIWYNAISNGDQYNFYMINEEVDGYHKYRRVLIGAFEGTVVDNILHSRITGNEATGNVSAIKFHLYANSIGKGWDIVDYESHCKIAWMYMAKYGDRNSQELIGYGSNSSSRIIGSTSILGNNDGTDNVNTSLFGLENWWGDKAEWMGGLYEWKNGTTGHIYQFDGFLNSGTISGDPLTMGLVNSENDYRIIGTVTKSSEGYISDVKLGKYGDLIPTKFNSSSNNTFYTDYGYVYFGSYVAYRSYRSADGWDGVFFLSLVYGASYAIADYGSRLQFRGKIRVIEDPQEFINL